MWRKRKWRWGERESEEVEKLDNEEKTVRTSKWSPMSDCCQDKRPHTYIWILSGRAWRTRPIGTSVTHTSGGSGDLRYTPFFNSIVWHTYIWTLSGRAWRTRPVGYCCTPITGYCQVGRDILIRWVIGPEKHLVLNIEIAHLYLNIVRTSVTYASGGSGDRRYTTNLEIREMVYTDTGIL